MNTITCVVKVWSHVENVESMRSCDNIDCDHICRTVLVLCIPTTMYSLQALVPYFSIIGRVECCSLLQNCAWIKCTARRARAIIPLRHCAPCMRCSSITLTANCYFALRSCVERRSLASCIEYVVGIILFASLASIIRCAARSTATAASAFITKAVLKWRPRGAHRSASSC